jgi:hypothetical protein
MIQSPGKLEISLEIVRMRLLCLSQNGHGLLVGPDSI